MFTSCESRSEHRTVVHKRKKSFVGVLFLVILLHCHANANSKLDELSMVVVYLHNKQVRTVVIDSIEREMTLEKKGTGFFVKKDDSLFLVTAQHLAKETTAEWSATIRTSDDRPMTFKLKQLAGTGDVPRWIYHENADVAVLRLRPGATVRAHLSGHFLPVSIVSPNLEAPSRERPVTALGFPLGLGVEDRFSPLSREAKPSSGLLRIPRADTRQLSTFYLLDSPSIGGFSGAPVFVLPGAYSSGPGITFSRRLACVGMIHGTISDDTGGKLAAVIPSAFIVETIEQALSSEDGS